jgi:hypothetical protein
MGGGGTKQVWKSIDIRNAEIGFELISKDWSRGSGSVMLVDSSFTAVSKAIFIAAAADDDDTAGITLDNVRFDKVIDAVSDTKNTVFLSGAVESIDTWVLGNMYLDPPEKLTALSNTFNTPREESLLSESRNLPKLPFFERSKPQYENINATRFIHVRDFGAKGRQTYARDLNIDPYTRLMLTSRSLGDGLTDDTAAFQSLFQSVNSESIIFIDAGSYLLTDTIDVPIGAKVVGQGWPQLVAYGQKFNHAQ